MEEVMPLEMITNNFKAHILKLTNTHKHAHIAVYDAVTSFGQMTLIV